jgi:hypothetical protein
MCIYDIHRYNTGTRLQYEGVHAYLWDSVSSSPLTLLADTLVVVWPSSKSSLYWYMYVYIYIYIYIYIHIYMYVYMHVCHTPDISQVWPVAWPELSMQAIYHTHARARAHTHTHSYTNAYTSHSKQNASHISHISKIRVIYHTHIHTYEYVCTPAVK